MEGSVSHHPGVVALSGDLDASQYVAVHGALAAALADDQPEIIVNLSAVRFLDAGTIRLLLEARQTAVNAGRRLRVSGAGAAVRHVIEASRLRCGAAAAAPAGKQRVGCGW